ncbi:MAG: hypothetical protein V2J51_10740 [Erythrobacter sp.]|nr:hypothetical protein [Erythrobacter sp.]
MAIITEPGDNHAHAVKWALTQKGFVCDLVFFCDLAQGGSIEIQPRGTESRLLVDFAEKKELLSSYDSIWLRRLSAPVLPHDMHPADKEPARVFWEVAIEGLLLTIGMTDCFIVNPPIGDKVSIAKPYHLAVADTVGLATPKSIVTNSAVSAREFIASLSCEGKQAIVKPLYGAVWEFDDGGLAAMDTQRIRQDEILDENLKLAPCIFQEEIPKSYEVRVTVMGRTILASRIDSQTIPEAEVDFRQAPNWRGLGCDEIEVPHTVSKSLFEFQRRLSLNFGTLDFIVTGGGEWIFLETNSMGNFLWVEDTNPQIPMLDAMAEYLISGDSNFVYDRGGENKVSLRTFNEHRRGESRKILEEEIRSHSYSSGKKNLDRALTK